MREIYSVEVDRFNPMALAHCLEELSEGIPDFEYNWTVSANAGGISYGLYLNIDVERKEIVICNQPEYGMDGDDSIEDVIEYFDDDTDDDLDEE